MALCVYWVNALPPVTQGLFVEGGYVGDIEDIGTSWVATQILVVSDLVRSRQWWTQVLGAEVYREYGGSSVVLRFAGMWLLLVTGGEPTADKPEVVLAPPASASMADHLITVRVQDCQAEYESVRARGGEFLTPPHKWGAEVRCFLRDPDGHLIELSGLLAATP